MSTNIGMGILFKGMYHDYQIETLTCGTNMVHNSLINKSFNP